MTTMMEELEADMRHWQQCLCQDMQRYMGESISLQQQVLQRIRESWNTWNDRLSIMLERHSSHGGREWDMSCDTREDVNHGTLCREETLGPHTVEGEALGLVYFKMAEKDKQKDGMREKEGIERESNRKQNRKVFTKGLSRKSEWSSGQQECTEKQVSLVQEKIAIGKKVMGGGQTGAENMPKPGKEEEEESVGVGEFKWIVQQQQQQQQQQMELQQVECLMSELLQQTNTRIMGDNGAEDPL
uniref:uncharacterized protein isoform X2 n=1 Tax=Myxine glutinosa TaxID=7769 RepID=UPI00358FBE9B